MSSSSMHLTDAGAADQPTREGLPFVPVLIGLGVIALLGMTAYQLLAPHPVGTVVVQKATALEMPPGDRVVVEVEIALQNTSDKPLKYHSTEIKLTTNDQEFKDEPAAATEVPRIYLSYPALKQSSESPLRQDAVLTPGGTIRGVVIVAFPVNKATFDARKRLDASVYFYDQAAIHTKK